MKVIKLCLFVLIVSVLASCDRPAVMKIYGDSSALDPALENLRLAFENSGKKLVVGSKYEVPDLVIVNGSESYERVIAVYGNFLPIVDTTQQGLVVKSQGKKQIVFVFGKEEKETIKGIKKISRNYGKTGSLVIKE